MTIDEEGPPNWGTYRSDDRYEVEFIGLGEPINAQFQDTDRGNNGGFLHLEILEPPG